MTPDELSTAIRACLEAAVAAGDLTVSVPAEIRVERPKQREHGDWSTNIALQLAKPAGKPPRAVAELLSARLVGLPGIKSVDIAGPGFLNIVLDTASAAGLVRTVVEAGAAFGQNQQLAGTVLNLEFVSANPTGPLHIGHTRWAALGDALARVLTASGAQVTREYYINDAGAQMDRFGGSILARIKGTEVPEGGYHGEYIAELAAKVREQRPDVDDLPDAEALVLCRELGYAIQLAENRQTLSDFGVEFDVWFSERTLHESGAVEAAVERLREQGHVFDSEGAIWLRTTDFGDDKDRVLIKADGEKTYFAADAAYWLSVRDRGFPKKIYMLGADHHGYVQRLKAIAACAGDDPDEALEVLIGQLVSVGGARLSKRAGNIIELKDLVAWLGADAVRYSLARYPADSPLTLDGEVLRKKSNDNPVFYVQYAHARLSSLANQAREHGVERTVFEPALLDHPTENELIAVLAQFPAVVAQAAELREPHRVARHLEVVAGAFHKWYDNCRVTPRGEDAVEDVHRTRLWLAEASRLVLANGLGLLGVSAPERM
ncbi:arginine--tRNA ligase [Kineosporia sp. J2-2]|uniref:Arginine--tRNA ligase n=1 Tax=Kineosporia corallincola TaxID=2835133 RepID=A0ABS5TDH8_9ACTN|nr:arginine--tRNA ligase [Kineosporia corallincola]MBT0768133.1 arginine--tRNA ligase [Kineosporia corallincola]